MSGIEPFIVFPMAAFHFPVMSGRIRPDQLVADAVAFQMYLKEGRLISVGSKAVGKLWSVVCLNAFNGKRERFHQMFHEHGGGISAVFLKGLHEPPSGVLVNGGILEKVFTNNLAVDEAGRGDEFHINLNTLSGTHHLLIGLRDIFRVRRMYSHDPLSFEEPVQSGDGAGVSALGEFDPENDKSGMRVTPAHVRDEFDLIGGMLVRVVVRSA